MILRKTPLKVYSNLKQSWAGLFKAQLNRSLSENSSCKQFQVQRYQEQHELNTLAEFGPEKCQVTTAEDRKKLGTKGWHSGESARLPPMWPGWVEFVVGSLLCHERFFSGFSGFPLSSKTNICKFQFDPGMHGHVLNQLLRTPKCSLGKQITFTFIFLQKQFLDFFRCYINMLKYFYNLYQYKVTVSGPKNWMQMSRKLRSSQSLSCSRNILRHPASLSSQKRN